MDNKYITAEEQDFTLNKDKNLIYIGNNEGIEYIDIDNIIYSNFQNNLNLTFNNNSKKIKLKGVKLSIDIEYMQLTFKNIQTDYLDLSEFNTKNVRSFWGMFLGAEINNINFKNFKTEKCINFRCMFKKAKIDNLDLSNFNFNQQADIDLIFDGFICELLTLPKSFRIDFPKNIFKNSKIKKIKTSNIVFYSTHKEWFKWSYDTELILSSK